MCSEELFEINQKISQIRNKLSKREQKMSEWSIPYKKILQEKANKQFYLSKVSKTNLLLQQCLQPSQKQKLIKQLINQSRHKIYHYHNQLKQLSILQKKKNLLRVNQHYNTKTIPDQQNKRDTYQEKIIEPKNLLIPRTLKDRTNPFLNIKIEKFLDFYQQIKKEKEKQKQKSNDRNLSDCKKLSKFNATYHQQLAAQSKFGSLISNNKSFVKQQTHQPIIQQQQPQKIKKHSSDSEEQEDQSQKIIGSKVDEFKTKQRSLNKGYQYKFPGIGIQNTLFFATIRSKQPRKQEKKSRIQKNNVCMNDISKRMEKELKKRPRILGYSQTTNFFEEKMKRILQWHGSFWEKDSIDLL